MNPDKWHQQIVDALDRLPGTAQGIADYFTEVGIKGTSSPTGCPLANYLTLETEAPNPSVGMATAWPAAVRLPEHVREFRENFDMRHYPHLEHSW